MNQNHSPENLELAAGLRAAMVAFVDAAGPRRVLPAVLHVGRPGGSAAEQWAVIDDPAYDAGLRADLVVQALDVVGIDDPCAWLTRSGELAPTDTDFAWFAASRMAFARLELPLPGFFVITRRGWLNLMTETVLLQPGIRPRRQRRRA